MRTKPLRFFCLLLGIFGLLGQTWIHARSLSGSDNNVNLTNTVVPPNITTQPVSQTVCSTSPASFSVAATNATSYRWQRSYDNTFNFPSNLSNTGVYSGADTPVLTISSVADVNGAYFRCVVTNGGESTNSEGVLLTVTTLPTATIYFSNPLFCSLDGSQGGVSRSGIGGNGGTYSSSPSGLSLTSDFGLVTPASSTPGSYTVTYTIPARGGCPVVTATTTLTITAPPTFTGNAVTQPTCATPTGTISVSATGSGTIEYSRNGTDWQPSGFFSGLNAGGYTIRVRSSDNLTCTRNLTLTVNAAPSAPTVSNPAVTTATTGTAFSQNFTASGGTTPYSYSLASGTLPTGLTLVTTGVLSGTPTEGGSFTITVRATGNNGCSGVGSAYILDVTAIPVAVINTQPVSQTVCSTSPVSFSVAATNATSYQWQRSFDNTFNFPSNLSNTGVYSGTSTPVLTISSASGLDGQYYRCVVTNGGGPVNSEGVLLTVTTLPTATIYFSNPLFCSLDGSQGGVSRSGIGGNGGTYSSSPSSLSLTSDFGLVTPASSTPGSYTVTYTIPARGGCPVVTATTTLTITAPPTFTGNAVTQPTCATPTGTISVSATGSGTIEYSRNGTDWQPSGFFSGLNAGGYTIRVRSSDNLTCTRNLTLTVNAAPSAPTVSNPAVTTATTGAAFSQNFTASGGTAPYSYSLASGTLPTGLTLVTTGVLSGTPTEGGSFTITVRATGNNGCSGVGTPYILDVTAIPVAVINTQPVSQTVCSTSPVSFSVAATNATSYQWQRSFDNTFNFPSNLSNTGVYSGTSTPVLTISSASGLDGQYYRCVVTNGGGPVNSEGVLLTVTTLPTATIYFSNPLFCSLDGSQGGVSRSGIGGNGGTYSSSPSSLSLTSDFGLVTPASSTPGSYTVTYTIPARGGCPVVTATTTLTITAPPTFTGNAVTQPTCATPTGTISVSATGSGTIEYSRNGTDWQPSGFFSGLNAGGYTIRVRSSDNLTCTRNLTLTVNAVPSAPTVSNPGVITATTGTFFSQNFTASGGTAPYSYSLASGTLPTGLTLVTTGVLSGTPTEGGSFTITVRATGNNGCSGAGSAYILTVGAAPSADLSISKTDGVSNLAPGAPTTYTITVSNAGPLAVTGATVTDIFPASITSVAWTATFTGGASGTGSGTGHISQQVNLPVGSSVTYLAVCATNPTSTGMLTNTASVITPGGITDPNPGTNSASDENNLTPSADLAVTLSDSPDPVAAGNNLTYAGQVSNLGPSTASTAQLSIPLSASTTFYSLSTPGGWSCNTPSVGTTGTVSCNRASFPSGTASFTLIVTTASGSEGSSLPVTATISSGTTDPSLDNNSATVSTSVVSGNANLSSLTLSVGSLSATFFPSVTSYSATVGNATTSLAVTPTAANTHATIQVRVNGGSYDPVTSGTASGPLSLTVGDNPIDVRVTAEDGVTTKTYRVTVTRRAETPIISTQSVSQTVCSTSPVSFSVSASNATTYQWQIAFDNTFNFPTNLPNSGVYSGTDTPVLTISSASGLDGRYYRCVVSNGGGGTNSDAMLLTVTTLPTVAISYNSTVFCNNTNELGLVTRSGIGGNGGTYSSNPTSLSINPGSGTVIPSYSTAGSYTVTYTVPASGGCPVVTATAALTVIAPPMYANSLLTQPTCATPTGTISVSATGSGTIEYSRNGTDWQPSGVFSGLDPGQYFIRVRSSDNPTCILTLGFTINAVPSSPTVSNPAVTTATAETAFSQNFTASGGTTPYSYSLASGTLPNGLNLATTGVLSGTPTETGSFTITVRGTGNNGCSGVGSVYVLTVEAAATVINGFASSPSAVCVGSPVTFTATIANVTGSYSYTLTSLANEDNLYTGTSSNPNFSQTIPAPGSGQDFMLRVNSNGMLATATQYLTVNALPVADLINNGPLTCSQTSVTLTASGGTSYTFTNGSGVVGTPGVTNTLVVSSPGTYSVTVANASGCFSTTTTTVSQDVTAASVSISPSSATLTCASPVVSLSAVGNGTVLWSTTETSPTISVSSSGTYSVTLTAGNGCTASSSVVISKDNSQPIVSISPSSATLTCASPVVSLSAVGNGTVLWSTTETSPTISVSSSGTYSVTVTAGNGCTASSSVVISEDNSQPTVSITPSSVTLTCASPVVSLTASGGGTYRWEDHSISAVRSITSSGTYSVTVTAGNGCTASSSVVISQDHNAPSVSISPSSATLTCASPVVSLSAVGSGTVLWSTTETSPTISVSSSGTYSVTVTAGNGCTASSSVVISEDNSQPTVSITPSSATLTCASPAVSLTASGGGTYRWEDHSTSAVRSITSSGTYSVTVTAGNGCTASSSVVISEDNSQPTVSITPSSVTLTCASPAVSLSAVGSGTVLWSTTETSPTISVSSSGTYSVTVTAGNGCTASSSVVISEDNSQPTVSITPSSVTLTCASPAVSLSAVGSGTVLWSTTETSPTISVSSSGTYSVTVTAGNGCTASSSVVISEDNSQPTVSITPSSATLTCASPAVSLTASGGGTYRWEDHSTSAVRSITSAGTYSVTVTAGNGCTASSSVVISEDNSQPTVSITPSSATLTCASPAVSLTASGGGTYRWEDHSTSAVRSVSSSGTYSVTVTAGNGCTASSSIQVSSNVVAPSAPNLTSTTVTQGALSVTLTADNCAGTITWTGPGGSSGTGPITVTTASPGTFSYVAACTINGCVSDPSSVTVVVTAPVVTGSFDGFIYGADCATFRGWAWDRNKPNTAISIDILEGSTVIATLMASEFRQDLLDQGKGNGQHAFFWPIPESLKDGLPHSLSARVTGNPFVLKDSPKVLICQPNPGPSGNKPPQPPVPTVLIAPLVAQVGVPFSGTLVAFTDPEGGLLTYAVTGLPGGLSLEMNRIISGTPTQSGTFVLTYQATDNQGATNSVSFQLTVNPAETTTVTGNFEGYLDKLDCGGIRGWVWDRNKPNTPLTVEFYTESSPGTITVLGSTFANTFRQDLKDASKGNGAHAYNFTPPGSVTNGTLVLARVLGSSYLLKGSPKAYQCAGARLSAEPKSDFQVILLGNPIAQDVVEIEIRGAEGEPLQIQLTDANGHLVREQHVPEPGAVERHQVSVAWQAPGILVLRVSTATRTKTVKVLKTK